MKEPEGWNVGCMVEDRIGLPQIVLFVDLNGTFKALSPENGSLQTFLCKDYSYKAKSVEVYYSNNFEKLIENTKI
jgi:hypothetical protein